MPFVSVIQIFGQQVEWADAAVVGLLVVLEGVLSIDNALVLGILAKRLRKDLRSRALTYGLIGAFVFRIIAIALAAYLLHWRIIKFLGGAYLLWVSVKHFFFEDEEKDAADPAEAEKALTEARTSDGPASFHPFVHPGENRKFWTTVGVIELTDIAFAVDSILAAIALVGPVPPGSDPSRLHPKLWVVVTGGFIGVILMRVAAVLFIKLLERFPRFETAAYLLVAVIGGKLLVDWWFNTPDDPHQINFHSPHDPAFWVFWGLMLACFLVGFLPHRKPVGTTT